MEFMAFVLSVYFLGIAYIRFSLEKEQKELIRKACLSHPYSAKYLRKDKNDSNLSPNRKVHIKTVLRNTASNVA